MAAALQLGESLVWKDKQQAETKPSAPPMDETQVKQPIGVKEPEPLRQGLGPTPTPTPGGISRPATSTNVEAEMAPTPDIPPTPAPSFPPNRDDVPETPLPNLQDEEEADRPPPTPTFHPPPGEPILQKKAGDLSSLPTPFGKTIPPLPFKFGGGKLPPVVGQGASDLDNLPSPPTDELPSYEEVEMADRLSGKKKKKHKESKAELEPL